MTTKEASPPPAMDQIADVAQRLLAVMDLNKYHNAPITPWMIERVQEIADLAQGGPGNP